MIKIIRKADNKQISNAEYIEFIKNKLLKTKNNEPLSTYFKMFIDEKEIDIDSIHFETF